MYKTCTSLPLILHDCLEFPCITNCVLDNLSAGDEDILFAPISVFQLREVYSAIFNRPSTFARKLNYAAFALKKEKVLGVRYGNRRIGLLRARSDF